MEKQDKINEIDLAKVAIPGIYIPGKLEPITDGRTDLAKSIYEPMGCLCSSEPAKELIVEQEPMLEKELIEQNIVPSTGTKLVCTTCGKADWHTLILRRKAGLLEGLCKQQDGSGCYPLASRNNCSYTYPNQVDCPQVSEYCVAVGKDRLNPRSVCRDHVGELLRHCELYTIWPLED